MNPEIYVFAANTKNEVIVAARSFQSDHTSDILFATKMYRPDIIFTLADGTEYHFMTYAVYSSWCLGKSYRMLSHPDVLYHSGHRASDTSS